MTRKIKKGDIVISQEVEVSSFGGGVLNVTSLTPVARFDASNHLEEIATAEGLDVTKDIDPTEFSRKGQREFVFLCCQTLSECVYDADNEKLFESAEDKLWSALTDLNDLNALLSAAMGGASEVQTPRRKKK